jgi:hypothetical protein
MSFREKAAKLQPPAKPTRVQPRASSGKNESITTELKDGLFEFFSKFDNTTNSSIAGS